MPPRRAAFSSRARSMTASRPPCRGCATRSSGWKSGSSTLARLLRVARIFAVGLRFGLYEFIPRFSYNRLFISKTKPRGQRLREALETLGPIFVKFGQVLSTRRDLLPLDIADELAKLQDQVPPFDPELAFAEIERSLGCRVNDVFAALQRTPIASASIAQVHL